MNDDSRELVSQKLRRALLRLLDNDSSLLERDVNERSITHWLAIYMMMEFEGYDIDCEYNRNGSVPKRIDERVKPQLTSQLSSDEWPEDSEGRTVFPDIIVHERGTNSRNHLVVEVKKGFASHDAELEKVKGYIASPQLRFEFGVLIQIGVGREAQEEPRMLLLSSDDLKEKEEGVIEGGLPGIFCPISRE